MKYGKRDGILKKGYGMLDDKIDFKMSAKTLCSFYSSIQEAGGSVEGFSSTDLEKLSAIELLKILACNHIVFKLERPTKE